MTKRANMNGMSDNPNRRTLKLRSRSGKELPIDVSTGFYQVDDGRHFPYLNDAFRRIFGLPEKSATVRDLYLDLQKTNQSVARIAARADASAEKQLADLLVHQNELTAIIIQKLSVSERLARRALIVLLATLALMLLSLSDRLVSIGVWITGFLR